ncbi:hypothetical protein [Mucilaginibacter sp. FT3.2]|uniref:hypothetical protein n=1 Tax=Mucilaginibacter sp. FT3.2 TaxID=2723090 RepID=UPI001613E055|nr:hypothetical protein [Mucilaginibacter sp. FT3.2]MBB6230632.1 drug/metabolite transporter (DMT)-like permease [Mucilaginibacter sp. FT3.2]
MPLDALLVDISIISGIFPVLVALYYYRQLNKTLKIASLYFLIAFLVDAGLWLSFHQWKVKNTMPTLHGFVVVSIVLFGLMYYNIYAEIKLKKAAIVLSVLAILITLFDARYLFTYPSLSITTLSLLLIVLSLIYFYKLLNPLKYIDIEKQGLFWINAGVLFYSSVNIFLFMLLTHIPVNDQHNYYIINSITNIIANILYSVGLLCKPQKTT